MTAHGSSIETSCAVIDRAYSRKSTFLVSQIFDCTSHLDSFVYEVHIVPPPFPLDLFCFCRTIDQSMYNPTLFAFSETCSPEQPPVGMRSGTTAIWLDELN